MKTKDRRYPLFLTIGLIMATLWSAHVQAGGAVTNCSDDSQFSSLLAGGGTVTFNCGTALIKLNSTQIIPPTANTTIDGGGKITLSGQNARQLSAVTSSATMLDMAVVSTTSSIRRSLSTEAGFMTTRQAFPAAVS